MRPSLINPMSGSRTQLRWKLLSGKEPQQSTWHLPKSLLTRYSTFFAGALNGEFREANQDPVKLPEVKPSVFELFVQWQDLGEYDKKEKGCKFREEPWVLGEYLAALLSRFSPSWHDTLSPDNCRH